MGYSPWWSQRVEHDFAIKQQQQQSLKVSACDLVICDLFRLNKVFAAVNILEMFIQKLFFFFFLG